MTRIDTINNNNAYIITTLKIGYDLHYREKKGPVSWQLESP